MSAKKIFVAYAPADEQHKIALSKHLSTLREEGWIDELSIEQILPGSSEEQSLRQLVSGADIILLLISADFLGDDDCQRIEDLAFATKARNGATIVPVLLRPCHYPKAYKKLSLLPSNKEAVTNWGDADSAYLNIVQGLKRLLPARQAESNTNNEEDVEVRKTVTVNGDKPSRREKRLSIDEQAQDRRSMAVVWQIALGALFVGMLIAYGIYKYVQMNNANKGTPVKDGITQIDNDKVDPPAETPVIISTGNGAQKVGDWLPVDKSKPVSKLKIDKDGKATFYVHCKRSSNCMSPKQNLKKMKNGELITQFNIFKEVYTVRLLFTKDDQVKVDTKVELQNGTSQTATQVLRR